MAEANESIPVNKGSSEDAIPLVAENEFEKAAALEGDSDVAALPSNQLQQNAMGLVGLLFAVISCVAPMAAAVFNTAVVAGYAGATAPLEFLIGAIGLLFLIAPISYFASRLSSTAGFYTWVAHGLGKDLGYITGWLVFGAYAIFEAASQAAFGGLMDVNLSTFFNVNIPGGYGWVIYALVSVLVVGGLGYLGVNASIRIMAVFSSLEILGLLIFNIAVTAHGGAAGQDFLHTFTPAGADASLVKGIAPGGLIGMGIALTLVVFSNIGFESASGYGEESRRPHSFIPRAMIGVLALTAVLYIWTAYSQVIGVGVDKAGSVLGNVSQAPGPFYGLAQTHVGYWFEVAIGILLTTSTWASCLAFHNVAARYLFNMAREDQIPLFSRSLGKTQERTRSPWVASLVQTVIALLFIVFLTFIVVQTMKDGTQVYAFGIAGGAYAPAGGIGTYSWLANIGTMTLIVVYILTAIAAPFYALKRQRESGTSEVKVFTHIVAPIVGIIVLLLPLLSLFIPFFGLGGVLEAIGFAPATFPLNILPAFFFAWLIVGIGALFYIRRSPERYQKIGHLVRIED
ncbi:MAG: APC family permease [Ktedonobacteraceae bacterium]